MPHSAPRAAVCFWAHGGWVSLWNPQTSGEVIITTTSPSRTWGKKNPGKRCPPLTPSNDISPKKVPRVGKRGSVYVVNKHFGLRFIELKESQLRNNQSASEQPFHLPETYAHGNEWPRSPRRPAAQLGHNASPYLPVLFRSSMLPHSWPFPPSFGPNCTKHWASLMAQ